ncbi:hypothetical protein ACF0H5_002686 [Mactra antiquata]
MSSAFVSPQFIDIEEVFKQNMSMRLMKQQNGVCPEPRNITNIGAPVNNLQRNRNFSIGNFTVNGNNMTPVIPMDNQTGLIESRKLDRSYSEPCDRTLNNNTNLNVQQQLNKSPLMQQQQQQQQQQQPAVNSSRYKTELCRPFEESGHCKYADKCQFAHGAHELKQLQRHPKYKTELCRTFHSKGFCPYGPRCNFIHNDDMGKVNDKNNRVTAPSTVQQPQNTQYFQHISPPGLSQSPPPMVQRPTSINFNSSFNGSMGSSADSSPPSSVGSESPSLSPVFFSEDINMMNTGYLSSNNSLNYDNSTNCNVFNLAPELATSFDLAPLKIQTQPQVRDAELGLLFNSILNLNNHNSNNNEKLSAFDDWDSYTTQQPPSSPDSISGESNASASSFGTNNTVSSCGSPMESGKNLRLPVFNHISQD